MWRRWLLWRFVQLIALLFVIAYLYFGYNGYPGPGVLCFLAGVILFAWAHFRLLVLRSTA